MQFRKYNNNSNKEQEAGHIIKAWKVCQKVRKCAKKNSPNWPKLAKRDQHYEFFMLKSTPSWKNYTTAGCGGGD